ncbi:MAG: hydroxymethylbilane synthase [Verrucomicrobia bacterium]|nr:hydroxymethylbilane synthase [Verrucomicrobiota bacterium]
MSATDQPIRIATRGSALALAQAHGIADACRAAFPNLRFEIKIIKTTGDKLQSVPTSASVQPPVKGLFTKELEVALLNREADLAVHSLKDLPTELPDGLTLAAVTKREDVRDVLIYRDAEFPFRTPHSALRNSEKRGLKPHATIRDFPTGATIATSSTRRQAQLLALRSDLKLIPIRGNVGTRLRKLAERAELDGLVLAAAGLNRLQVRISADGKVSRGEGASSSTEVPQGLLASPLALEEMLPCVGQGAIGIEARCGDERIAAICQRLNHPETLACVTAERAFLRGMGGGCLSPIAALAENAEDRLRLRGVSFQNGRIRRGEVTGFPDEADAIGGRLASELK